MASTYTPIATTTGTGSSGTVSFTSIPSTYTDLVLVTNVVITSNDRSVYLQFNGDTATNYSMTILYGNGTSAVSGRTTSAAQIFLAGYAYGTSTTNPSTVIANIQNYANTTTNKTVLGRAAMRRDDGNGETDATVGLWRSTAAINRIDVIASAGNWATTSTFTLYGIKAA